MGIYLPVEQGRVMLTVIADAVHWIIPSADMPRSAPDKVQYAVGIPALANKHDPDEPPVC